MTTISCYGTSLWDSIELSNGVQRYPHPQSAPGPNCRDIEVLTDRYVYQREYSSSVLRTNNSVPTSIGRMRSANRTAWTIPSTNRSITPHVPISPTRRASHKQWAVSRRVFSRCRLSRAISSLSGSRWLSLSRPLSPQHHRFATVPPVAQRFPKAKLSVASAETGCKVYFV